MTCFWRFFLSFSFSFFNIRVCHLLFLLIKRHPTNATYRVVAYVEGSRRWAGLCISRASWRHTPYSGRPAAPDPTAVPRTRSSKSATTRSRWRSCAASCSRSGRWAPAASSCTRAVSVYQWTHTKLLHTVIWLEDASHLLHRDQFIRFCRVRRCAQQTQTHRLHYLYARAASVHVWCQANTTKQSQIAYSAPGWCCPWWVSNPCSLPTSH